MAAGQRILIVGGGIMGVTAALELRRRQANVTLIDPGPLPHPEASSTDISKMVRMDYGSDALYTEWMEEAFPRWRAWNERWGEALYHEDGFVIMAREEMRPGGFEYDSYRLLQERGYAAGAVGCGVAGGAFPGLEGGELCGWLLQRAGWLGGERERADAAHRRGARGRRGVA